MGISRESAWRPRQSPAGPGVRPEIPAPTERLVPPPPPPSHQLADRRPQTLLQNPSLTARLYPERAVDGHELPVALGTAPSGILSETHLGLTYVSNHRMRLQWKPEATRGFEAILSHFPSFGSRRWPANLGTERDMKLHKKCQVVFFPSTLGKMKPMSLLSIPAKSLLPTPSPCWTLNATNARPPKPPDSSHADPTLCQPPTYSPR